MYNSSTKVGKYEVEVKVEDEVEIKDIVLPKS